MRREILRMKDICTSERSIETVRNGNFHVFENEIVGLVGKNHAGKSTLMGAVTGEYPCNSGEIWIEERKKCIETIQQARKAGVFLIKDSSSLIDGFTIEDTMRLNFAFAGKGTKYSHYVKKYRNTLNLLEVSEHYDTLVRNLNFHKRVLIEIAQALVCNAKLLVLDNVVSMLSNTARQEFHRLFQVLLKQGLSIVIIESQEKEMEEYLERLCVMRKGRVVAELSRKELDHNLICALVEGEPFIPQKSGQCVQQPLNHRSVVEFRHVSTEDRVIRGLTFSVYKNETLGIWNRNRHSGKAILDILEGKSAVVSGDILVDGKAYRNTDDDRIWKYRLLTVPEKDELFSNMDLGENISVAAMRRMAYLGIVQKEWELRYLVQMLCGEYLSDPGARLFPNQRIPDGVLIRKKVALCRAVAAGAGVIVYNNPCLKMDLQEREIFAKDILKTQKRNITQVIISSQLDTLYPVCNRILQVEMGQIAETISV